MLRRAYDQYKKLFITGILAVFIGIIVGILDTCFGKILIKITEFRMEYSLILIPFLSLAGVFILFLYKTIGKNSIKGMTLVFEVAHGEEEKIPIRLIPLTIISTWITHLFGGSAGREGVAVQIGATVADGIGRKVSFVDNNNKKILILTGMAAGFAGLFQTPIAAVFFALEVLVVGSFQYLALFPALIGAFTASYTSHFLGLEKFSVILKDEPVIDIEFIVKIILVSIIFGIVGGLFAKLLKEFKDLKNRIFTKPYQNIFFIGILLSILFLILYKGRYSGLGTNLIEMSFHEGVIYNYDWILKLLLTILTISADFQGGEVTPLFSIGSSLGIVLGSLMGLPTAFVAALGYASVFGSATNTLLAPMFIGAEVFGFEYIPYFFVTCAIAYIFNGNQSIYSAQKKAE